MQTQEITNNTLENNLSTLADFGLRVVQKMTTPSRPNKKPRPVWIAEGNTFGLEEFFRTIGGKKFRGMWSFFGDPSDEILAELTNNGRKSFAEQIDYAIERKEAKADRYEGYAENAQARAQSRHKSADHIMSFIPAGQPILVGHHSEKRHRRDLDRITSNIQKGFEESKKSEYFSEKAASLRHDAKHMTYSRKFIGNRIADATKDIAQLNRYLALTQREENKKQYAIRINQAQEKLEFWQNQLKTAEQNMFGEADQIPSSENIKVGDEVYFREWFPVVRVNRKTVTVLEWLGVKQFEYKIPYTKIQKFRKSSK